MRERHNTTRERRLKNPFPGRAYIIKECNLCVAPAKTFHVTNFLHQTFISLNILSDSGVAALAQKHQRLLKKSHQRCFSPHEERSAQFAASPEQELDRRITARCAENAIMAKETTNLYLGYLRYSAQKSSTSTQNTNKSTLPQVHRQPIPRKQAFF